MLVCCASPWPDPILVVGNILTCLGKHSRLQKLTLELDVSYAPYGSLEHDLMLWSAYADLLSQLAPHPVSRSCAPLETILLAVNTLDFCALLHEVAATCSSAFARIDQAMTQIPTLGHFHFQSQQRRTCFSEEQQAIICDALPLLHERGQLGFLPGPE